MLRVITRPFISLKTPMYASIALAFSSFGDAFLYPFLPIHAEKVGIPLVWIGVLLSINRFIRIFSNHLMAGVFRRVGFRYITIVGVILAVCSTAGYGLGWGIAGWFVLRILWGISFSALRISSLGYALEHPRPGFSLGISRSIYELGPMFALVAGPFLLKHWSPSLTFIALAVASLPAIYFAWKLPDLTQAVPARKVKIFRMPSTFNLLTFIATFLVEGMLIVLLGKLLLEKDGHLTPGGATALAAAWLAFRRVSFLIFAPLGGSLADRWGFQSLFSGSVIFICLGFTLLLLDLSFAGLSIVFMANSINASLAPGGASQGEEDRVTAVAENATWRDTGAALGTLAGGFLLSSDRLPGIFFLILFVLLGILCIHLKRSTYFIKN